MTCVYCKGVDIVEREVEEDIRSGADVFRTRVTAEVCLSCGERYYDSETVDHLQRLRHALADGKLDLKEVGRVLEEA